MAGSKIGFFGLLAVPLMVAAAWLVLGERSQQSQAFLERIDALGSATVVRHSGTAQALAPLCGFRINEATDKMIYKAAGLRLSKLAKDAQLRAAFASGQAAARDAFDAGPAGHVCAAALKQYGPAGEILPSLLAAAE